MCFTEAVARELKAIFEAKPMDQRPQLTIFAAAKKNETSKGVNVQRAFNSRKAGNTDLSSRSGGKFTNTLLDNSNVANGNFNGPSINTDGSLPGFNANVIRSTPQGYFVSGNPSWCQEENETTSSSSTGIGLSSSSESSSSSSSEISYQPVSIEVDKLLFDATHIVGTTECSQYLGSFVIQNISADQGATYTVSAGNPAITLIKSDQELSSNGTATVNVYFNCSTQTSFQTTISIEATGKQDGMKDSATIGVTMEIQ